jgi:hypothetical protein
MSVSANWDSECAGKSEIGKFEDTITVDEKVLGFQITVKNTMRVTEVDSFEHLVHQRFDLRSSEAADGLVPIHVPFEVMLETLKHKV